MLDEVMLPHGFVYFAGPCGWGSGGAFASGYYVRDDRKLEFHVRFNLGLVAYHIGLESVDHGSYMRALLGRQGGSEYPGFFDEPMSAFTALRHDLEKFCEDFLSGEGQVFRNCVTLAKQWDKLSGFERLANSES